MEYKYSLDPSSSKFICPECGEKTFNKYVDNETEEYLPGKYGKCERVNSCQYHYYPKQRKHNITKQKKLKLKSNGFFIPEDVLKQTFKDYNLNYFVKNLCSKIPQNEVKKIIELYKIGTVNNKEWKGATTFPYIDIDGNITAIQVVRFDSNNHRDGYPTFLHEIIDWYYRKEQRWWSPHWNERLQKYVMQQTLNPPPDWLKQYRNQDKKIRSLFGEHLLNEYPNTPIALCESPKTCIYASLYYGNKYLWLSTYNLQGFNYDKCKVLEGRKVYVFPDLDGHWKWKNKAKELNSKMPGTKFIIDKLLSKNASPREKQKGMDLADYLCKFDWHKFSVKTVKNENYITN